MELCKLTVSREDVILTKDIKKQNDELASNKNKNQKHKKYVRKVECSTSIINRILPYCNRKKCRRAQYYHKITSKNIKRKDEDESAKKKVHSKDAMNVSDVPLSRILQSPITITSSNDSDENISSCDFNIPSSDSDELEDLIKLTRQRMKNEKNKHNDKLSKNPDSSPHTLDEYKYENISSDEKNLSCSIHSLDTIVLQHEESIHSPPLNLQHSDIDTFMKTDEDISVNKKPTVLISNNNNEPVQDEMPSPSSQESNTLSYEISGKVFMEHYLNTSII